MEVSPDIFLSYSREDLTTARQFAEAMQREGFRVWWDQALTTGATYDQVTEQALESARGVVVLWSKASVASRWVRAEAITADRAGTLMPVMIEACRRPVMFELTQTAELTHWKGDAADPAWRAFVADLRRLVQPAAAADAGAPAEVARGVPVPAAPAPVATARRARPAVLLLALAGVAVLAAGGWIWQRAAATQQARSVDIPAIAALVEADDLPAAFERAAGIRHLVPDDPLLTSLTPLFTVTYAIETTPAGAEVHVRGFEATGGEWQYLGRTPLARVELPRRTQRWRFEKPGFVTTERASVQLPAVRGTDGTFLSGALSVALQPADEVPADMVHVPAGWTVARWGQPETEIPAFFIDRHEVTNARYKEFVDAGGYERSSLWEGLDMEQAGKPLSIEDARRLFVDATGRPGPETWELGSYPDGADQLPVSGISWYEAQAYARFRGRSLPTIYHWLRAAYSSAAEGGAPAIATTGASQFDAPAPAVAGQRQGVGPFGTYDLFGNAREWAHNRGPGGGWVLGGSWEDPAYMYSVPIAQDLLTRSPRNGLRLVQEIGTPENAAQLRAAFTEAGLHKDPAALTPVSDQVFAMLQGQLAYRSGATNPTAPVTMAETADWTQQRVTIDAGYNGERMDLIVFVPRRARPPFQPLVFFSGSNIFTQPAASKDIQLGPLDHFVKSGRMVVQPIFQGSYERMKTPLNLTDMVTLKRLMVDWRWDLGRTIDYLESRPDVDAGRVGYVGASFGGSAAVPLLAVEPRIRTAVLLAGGWWVPAGWTPAEPLLNPANFAPRITMPVLMVSGRFEELFTVEASQLPLMRLLGTAPADKRHVLVDAGHGRLPRAVVLSETRGWLDRYLGEVRH